MKAESGEPTANPRQEEMRQLLDAARTRGGPDVASKLSDLGARFRDATEFSAAQQCFETALDLIQRVAGHDHPGTASFVNAMGVILWDQGRVTEAMTHYHRALQLLESAPEPDLVNIMVFRANLGEALTNTGELEEARGHLQAAVRYFEAKRGKDHWRTVTVLRDLARLDAIERRAGRGPHADPEGSEASV